MSINEIIGTIQEGGVQVCATADAKYDFEHQKITVALGAFARRISPASNGSYLPEPWLPRSERVSEHLSYSESDEFVKDVFRSWLKKVRAAVPQDQPLSA